MEVTISAAREKLAELVNECAYGRKSFILSRRGKPLAALVPIAVEENKAEEQENISE